MSSLRLLPTISTLYFATVRHSQRQFSNNLEQLGCASIFMYVCMYVYIRMLLLDSAFWLNNTVVCAVFMPTFWLFILSPFRLQKAIDDNERNTPRTVCYTNLRCIVRFSCGFRRKVQFRKKPEVSTRWKRKQTNASSRRGFMETGGGEGAIFLSNAEWRSSDVV